MGTQIIPDTTEEQSTVVFCFFFDGAINTKKNEKLI
jgi:hypothetical protein